MKCPKPIDLNGKKVGCGQCLPCRINKQREKAGVVMAEFASQLDRSSFITLTYDNDHLPLNGSLSRSELTNFIQSLRNNRHYTANIRYFGCGEYGDQNDRPHYHVIMFGACPHKYEALFHEVWGKGHTKTQELDKGLALYCCKYTLKKLTKRGDERLDGKHPEFFSNSRRPILGYQTLNKIEDMYYSRTGAAALAKYKDISPVFRYQGDKYPLPNSWMTHLRTQLNVVAQPKPLEWELPYEQIQKEIKQANQRSEKAWRRYKSNSIRRPL